ncbi:MAG: SpoIIE family protein phosphatase [Xanthomonadales bacterium]|nr:SpoIIE family protein phosphatase [Xanthomonadales bacterium]
MRIRNIARVLFGTVVGLFTLTGVCVIMLNTAEFEKQRALQREAEFRQLGVDLADASDFLTREVRRYVQFAEVEHREKFWSEVREERTRDRVIARLRELGAPASEIALLEDAKRNSDALIAVEVQAMDAAAAGDFETARRLVFDWEYDALKQEIMAPIVAFQQAMSMRVAQETQAASTRADWMLLLSNILILTSALVTVSLIYHVLIRRTVRPVNALTESMRALAGGNVDAGIPDPVVEDEIAEMIRATQVFRDSLRARERLEQERAARARELDQKNAQLEEALKQIEEELEIARRMQQSILPHQFPARHVQAFGEMVSARELGGDFYDVIEIDRDRIGIVIADVSGKGVSAALFMAVSSAVMKSVALRGGGPGEVLMQVNELLSRENDASMFVTLFYGIIDSENDELEYANAGHNPPYLLTEGNKVQPLEHTRGVALGVTPGLRYASRSLRLHAGDTIFCYSDGVTEATNPEGLEFGDERLAKVLYASHGLEVEALGRQVIDGVTEFAQSERQFDDITCVVLRYQPCKKPMPEGRLQARFAVDNAEIERMAGLVRRFGERYHLPAELTHDIALALEELFSNIISYGYDAPKAGEHSIALEIELVDGVLKIRLEDDGRAFSPDDAEPPDLGSPLEERRDGGLGLHFVRNLVDEVDYRREDDRNILTLVKAIPE